MAAATLTFPSQTLLKNVVDPVDGTDAATKEYVDGRTGSGSVAAAGSNTQVQYNSASTIGASSALTFDYVGNILTITGNIVSNNANLGNLAIANYVNVANNLKVSGDANIVGNLTVLGSVSYIQTTTTYVTDPISEIGGGNAGAALSTNDNMDRGLLLHYYTTKPVDSFIGWDNSNAEFALAGNVTVLNNVVTYNDFGNVRLGNIAAGNLINANYFTGDGGLLSNIQAAGGAASTVSASAQPNITTVGNLLNLTVGTSTPNVSIDGSGNVTIGNNITIAGTANTANLIVTSLTATRIPFANTNKSLIDSANLVFTSSSKTLSVDNVTMSGTSNSKTVISTDLSNTRIPFTNASNALVDSANLTFNTTSKTLSADLFTGTLTTSSQPNITSVGTLTSLNVNGQANTVTLLVGNTTSNVNIDNNGDINAAGNITVGDGTGGSITGANSVTANYFIGDGSQLTGVAVYFTTGTATNANYAAYAGNVVNASQSNITTLGTLTSLTVSGSISGQSNLTVSNNLTSTKLTVTGNSILQGNVEIQKPVTITDSTDSTNSSTGALILTLGGLGVYGNINSGMDVSGITLTGNITTASQPNITSVGTLRNTILGSGNSFTGGNLVSANYLTGTITTASQPNITTVGTLTNTTLGASNSFTGGNLVSANYLTGTITTASQPNITSLGTLTSFTSNGTINFTNASNVSLGTIANVHIGGGTSGQYLKTDGSGTISWATVDATKLANGTTEIDLLHDGNINFTVGTQTNSVVFVDDGSVILGSGSGGNIDGANVVNANTVAASNTITRNGRTVATYVSSTTMPTNPQVGDEWYDQTLHKIYQYIYDGSAYNWIDVSAGYIVANVQVQSGTIVVRDNNGNIYGNSISANTLSVANLEITGITKISGIVSEGSGKPVSNSSDTLIDIFPKTSYRSAKYIISAKNDDGFEVAELLLIHDDTISFIQTYGDVSTGTVPDIVTFSSNVVGANVCLYATGSNSNTFVNLVSTYVTD